MLVPTQFNWSSVIGSGQRWLREARWNCRLALQQNGEFFKNFPLFHTLNHENEVVPKSLDPPGFFPHGVIPSPSPQAEPNGPLTFNMNDASRQPSARHRRVQSFSDVSQQSAIITVSPARSGRPAMSSSWFPAKRVPISHLSWKLLLKHPKGRRERKKIRLS